MTEGEKREMMRSNYAAQMEMMGFDAGGNPLDMVHVVRCKDCVHFNTIGCGEGFGWCEGTIVNTGVTDTFFCAEGERKGKNNDRRSDFQSGGDRSNQRSAEGCKTPEKGMGH